MKKFTIETIVGIFVFLGIVALIYMTIKLGKVSLFGTDYYALYAHFGSVSGLRVGSPIEIDGIEVGRVEELNIDQAKNAAVVELKIKKGIKVFDDAQASIKTAGLIGDKYVDIDPGGGGDLLTPGANIVQTNSPVNLEDLIGKYAFGDVGKEGGKK